MPAGSGYATKSITVDWTPDQAGTGTGRLVMQFSDRNDASFSPRGLRHQGNQGLICAKVPIAEWDAVAKAQSQPLWWAAVEELKRHALGEHRAWAFTPTL